MGVHTYIHTCIHTYMYTYIPSAVSKEDLVQTQGNARSRLGGVVKRRIVASDKICCVCSLQQLLITY